MLNARAGNYKSCSYALHVTMPALGRLDAASLNRDNHGRSVSERITVPSSQPTVDKNSCDAEIEPSVGCDEGTVDRLLNEAPQCPVCHHPLRHVMGKIHFCCKCVDFTWPRFA